MNIDNTDINPKLLKILGDAFDRFSEIDPENPTRRVMTK